MNMQAMLKQAQKMQKGIMESQKEIEAMEFEGKSSIVTVKMNGKKELKSVKISPDVLDDAEMLQDLVLTAVNEVLRQADELTANEMKKFNLPF